MAYFLLIVTLLCLSVKGFCGKKTSTDLRQPTDPMLFNLLRMLFCVVIGLALILIEGTGDQLGIEAGMLWITLGAGLANVAFLIGWILAVRRIPLVTMDVSLTIGSLLPAVLCLILFGYVAGIASKFLNEAYMASFATKWYVLVFYVLNFLMVFADLMMYVRNYRLDMAAKKEAAEK